MDNNKHDQEFERSNIARSSKKPRRSLMRYVLYDLELIFICNKYVKLLIHWQNREQKASTEWQGWQNWVCIPRFCPATCSVSNKRVSINMCRPSISPHRWFLKHS